MKVRTAELLMAIATLLVALGLMLTIYLDGLRIGWVDGRGPGSGMWPFWLSGGMALAATATLIRCLLGQTPESRSDERYIASETLSLVLISVVALLGLLLLMQVIGTYLSLMIFMFIYVRLLGKHSWGMTIAMVLGTPIFCYLLFEVALTKYLPKGLPMFEDAFLVIDDLRYTYFH